MRKLAVHLKRSPHEVMLVGHLAESDRRIYFEYAPDFLQKALPLSPFKLPAQSGVIEHVDRAFGPIPGLFEDSLPDAWGLLLMDRAFHRAGLEPRTVSPLERLVWLGTRTMGALTYHPPRELEPDDRTLDLPRLAANAQDIAAGTSSDVLPELMRTGGSPGGTRPKVLVGLRQNEVIAGEDDLPEGYEHWIIKFAARQDARDAGPIEYAYALMAEAAGIDLPPVRLFKVARNMRCFGIRRFDRGQGNRRFHVHTFGNLIHSNYKIPGADYADLFKVTNALTRNQQDVQRVYCRMLFNIAAHNRDDHVKNFAFLMDADGQWSLSPAYDLTYSPGPGGEHTMTVLGEGRRPTAEHCLKLARQYLIRDNEAKAILNQVNEAVRRWPKFAAEAGCTKTAARRIADQLSVL